MDDVRKLILEMMDDDPDVRSEAAERLGGIKDPNAVPALIEAVKEEEPHMRYWAAWALGKTKDKRAVSALVGALKDESKEVRYWAAKALGRIQDESSVPRLIDALKDEDKEVQERAAKALAKIAEVSDIDLALVEDALQEYVQRIESRGDEENTEAAKGWASQLYVRVADAVRGQKKETLADGMKLKKKTRTPKKKLYRTRRAVNG